MRKQGDFKDKQSSRNRLDELFLFLNAYIQKTEETEGEKILKLKDDKDFKIWKV
jgi:hypothetical protein